MYLEAPLSHGQLYSWREIETYPAGGLNEGNLPTSVDLRGVSPARVEAALRTLTSRHETLRTTYHLSAGAPVQRVHDEVEPPVERIDRHITDVAAADRMTEEFSRRPFPMTGQLGWAGLLVTTGGEPMFIAFSYFHSICDVWSTLELKRQFTALLLDPDAPAPPGPNQRELSAAQHAPSWAARQLGAREHWSTILRDDDRLRLPTLPFDTTGHRIQATLHSAHLGQLAAEAARRHRVTVPAVVMAFAVAGMAKHTGARRIPVSVMSSNRFAEPHRRAIGTYNQLVPVITETDPARSVAEHVSRAHWTVAKGYRHGCYDIDLVAEQAAAAGATSDHDCWFNQLFQNWFNYIELGPATGPPGDATPAELVWSPSARPFGQPIDVRVTANNGRTSVALRTDPDVLGPPALTDILRTVAGGVAHAAAEPGGSLHELWRLPEDHLPDSLFPRAANPAVV